MSRENIRLKINQNKAFTIDKNIKLKKQYSSNDKDLLIIVIEWNDVFASKTYHLPLEYLSYVCSKGMSVVKNQ